MDPTSVNSSTLAHLIEQETPTAKKSLNIIPSVRKINTGRSQNGAKHYSPNEALKPKKEEADIKSEAKEGQTKKPSKVLIVKKDFGYNIDKLRPNTAANELVTANRSLPHTGYR